MEKQKHGGDIYSQEYRMDYSSNINPLGPPSSVAEAVYKSAEQIMHYPDVQCRELRKALAEHEYINPDWLIFGNGAAELIFAFAFAWKPKKAVLAAPCFLEYEEALKAVNCEVRYYETNAKKGFALEESFLECLEEDVDMVILCNPNNPTGTVIPQELLRRIADRCQSQDIMFMLDECFNEFLDAPDSFSMKTFLGEYQNLFLLNAFTKIYAMPGLRLGYGMTANKELIVKMQKVIQPWSVSIPAQMAGTAALLEDAYVYQSRWLVKEERRFLKENMKKLRLEVFDSKANYLFFKGPTGLEAAMKKEGILIRDCSNYTGLRDGYYRVAVRTRAENLELIQAFERAIQGIYDGSGE